MRNLYKKSYILSILFVTLFSGCTLQKNITFSENTKEIYIEKEDLIQKANNNNLNAIIQLAEDYEYQYTKEGLNNFEKWYKNLNKHQDGIKLTKLAKIYANDYDLFINGTKKVEYIYNLATLAGDKNAVLNQIEFYLNSYRSLDAIALHKELLPSASKEQLYRLLDIYTKKRKDVLRDQVLEKLSTKELINSITYLEEELKRYSYKRTKSIKKEQLLQLLIDTKNIALMNNIANKLNNYSYSKISYQLYNEILKLDSNNSNSLLQLAKLYKNGNYRANIKRDKVKSFEYFKKAYNAGNFDAKIELLKVYASNQKDIDKYIAIKEDILKTTEGKLALVDYFYNINDSYSANVILVELINKNNINAKIKQILIAKTNYKYNKNPEFTIIGNKLQNSILKSNNELHKKRLIEVMSSKEYKKWFINDLKNYYEQNPSQMNIKNIRDFSTDYRVSKEERLKWTNKLIEMGDIKTINSLADDYRTNFGLVQKDLNKRIELLERLSKKGHYNATITIAKSYLYSNNKEDIKKGLAIYTKLANKGNEEAQKFLANHYLCDSCSLHKEVNYKKAYYWSQILAEKGSSKHIFVMGWMYHYGKGVEIDYQKAASWYQKVVGKSSNATNNLGILYFEGKGVKQDYKKAFELYELSSNLYNNQALNNLADMYRDGIYVKKDIKKAKELYKKSGLKVAKESLKKLEEQGL